MSELENDEINRQLCAVDTFSWSGSLKLKRRFLRNGMIAHTMKELRQNQVCVVMNVVAYLRVRTTWTDIWNLTVTKPTSVRVVAKSLIERYVIYRDIFQNIIKHFELIISIYMISRMLWTDTWKLTVTKTTSVRVATKRLIGRYVIYRNIFQNIVKYFELIISTYIISRMLWTDIRKCTSDVARNGNILVMYVVKYSAIYSHSKPINTMSIKLAVGNVRRRRPGERRDKELCLAVKVYHKSLFETFFEKYDVFLLAVVEKL
jgi:hypothetical protein